MVRWDGDAGSGTYDFQIILHSDGAIRCNYRNMDGTINQATIGWQNSLGSEGTQLSSSGDDFASSNFTWEAKVYPEFESIDWLILSSDDGSPAGTMNGSESVNIYAQTLALDLDEGDYYASINIISPDTDPVAIPVSLSVNGENLIPTLPVIDITQSQDGIVYLSEDIDPMFTSIASRYTHVVTPNGDAVLDNCGICDDDPTNDCVEDCLGVWGGDAELDVCGVCDGGNANDGTGFILSLIHI